MTKPKLEWTKKGEASDFDAAANFLSLLYPDAQAKALIASLRKAKLIDHAAKDLLRAAQLPLLPRDEPQSMTISRGSTRANRSRRFCSFEAT
jgi:hypothetical protein